MHDFETRARDLVKQGDKLFTRKKTLDSLHQEIADHFYPERADFTVQRHIGNEFASNLSTSYPIMARRELGNTFSSMLRRKGTQWFYMSPGDEEPDMGHDERLWMEHATKVMRRAMYDKKSQFVRATKEGDHDYSAFGQCVISTELNKRADGLLYRCWHLRDVAWSENEDGEVEPIHRKWQPEVREICNTFKDVHEKVKETRLKDPFHRMQCRHVVISSEEYDETAPNGRPWRERFPYVSIYLDVENEKIMHEQGTHNPVYTIPRWQTVSGSQYAYSPSTVAALPDARLIQSITLTLLEAGEKATNPPMIGQSDIVRSDISLFSGGVTWIDSEYDERLGEALRPVNMDYSGLPIGADMQQDIRMMIDQAFYLNQINLPPAQTSGEMTAYEVAQRIEEYVRRALPLFEPMETDYNGSLCENTFDLLLRNGAFGSVYDMPESLQGKDVEFKFTSPLHDAEEKQKAQVYTQSQALLAQALELDPGARHIVDVKEALRDALKGQGAPAEWMRDHQDVESLERQDAEQQARMAQIEQMKKGAEVAESLGKANQSFAQTQTGTNIF